MARTSQGNRCAAGRTPLCVRQGQKVHFERLKKHVPAPCDWAAHQPIALDQNVANIADPYVEASHDEFASDISRDSFLPDQLPESSFELVPTRPVLRRTIHTRTQTRDTAT